MRRKTSGLARILNFVLLSIAWVTMVAAFPNTAVASVSFQSVVAYDAGAPCLNSVVAADVNADGKPDVLTVGGCPDINYQGLPGSVSVLLSNGDGTFQPAVLYASGGVNTTSLQVADVNGDGKPRCRGNEPVFYSCLSDARSLSTAGKWKRNLSTRRNLQLGLGGHFLGRGRPKQRWKA